MTDAIPSPIPTEPKPTRSHWGRHITLGFGILVGLGGLFLVPAVHRAREAAAKARCNLGQIRLAFHNYNEEYGQLPPATVTSANGDPLYSWRVLLLPYLDSVDLYKQFHLDEPWDSPHNRTLLHKMPSSYAIEWKGKIDVPPDHTVYRVFTGPGTLFEGGVHLERDCTDERNSTLLFVESGEPVPWTKPEDLEVRADQPIRLSGVFKGVTRALALTESYKFLPDDLDQATLHALVTCNGGEKIRRDWSRP